MKNRLIFLATSIALFTFTVSLSATTEEHPETPNKSEKLAKPTDAEVKKRVAEAKERLRDSKAGKLVWSSIEAHGGLAKWYSNGPVYFRYNYVPLGDRTTRDTYQTVDTWSARARLQMVSDKSKEYGWTGSKPWQKPADWTPPHHVAFWALTPYYFVAMPFVLSDPGVNLEYKGLSKLGGDEHHLIYVTFDSNTGQSPDDYYYVYLDKKSKKLDALRYIVAYEPFFPEGGHSPEKILDYRGTQQIDGITFAKTHHYYKWNPDKKLDGKKVTNGTVSDVSFRPDTPDSYFDMPESGSVWEPSKK